MKQKTLSEIVLERVEFQPKLVFVPDETVMFAKGMRIDAIRAMQGFATVAARREYERLLPLITELAQALEDSEFRYKEILKEVGTSTLTNKIVQGGLAEIQKLKDEMGEK